MVSILSEIRVDREYISENGNIHIDWNDLWDRLFGEKEFIQQMADVFMADSEQRFAELKEAVDKKDIETIKKVAHAIKGSALTVSAVRIADIAIQIEKATKDGKLDNVSELFENIQLEIKTVREIMSFSGWIEIFQESC